MLSRKVRKEWLNQAWTDEVISGFAWFQFLVRVSHNVVMAIRDTCDILVM